MPISSKLKNTMYYPQNLEKTSSFDYGLNIGRRFKFHYYFIDFIVRFLKKVKIDKKTIQEQQNTLKNYFPSALNEFEGLSASTHIKLERLIYLHNFLHYILGDNCTNILATGKATKDNNTFLIQNLDGNIVEAIILRFFSLKICVVKPFDSNSYRYAYFGIPILFEIPLLNEKGLGHGETAIICNKNRYKRTMDKDGIYINTLIRATMKTCKNVYEVASLWEKTKIGYSKKIGQVDQATAWCDKEGGILSIEVGPRMIKTVFGDSTETTGVKKGILWHARHHQWLNPLETGSVLPNELPTSLYNAERAKELLQLNYGNISIDTCKNIARDHGKGEFDALCKHRTKKRPVLTIISYIIQPKDMAVYLTQGSPCKSKFRKYILSKKLNRG